MERCMSAGRRAGPAGLPQGGAPLPGTMNGSWSDAVLSQADLNSCHAGSKAAACPAIYADDSPDWTTWVPPPPARPPGLQQQAATPGPGGAGDAAQAAPPSSPPLQAAPAAVPLPASEVRICAREGHDWSAPPVKRSILSSCKRALESAMQHSTACYTTPQHSTAQHGTARHSIAQRSAVQHSTAQRCINLPWPGSGGAAGPGVLGSAHAQHSTAGTAKRNTTLAVAK